jgi:hypothetical protein
MTMSEPTYTAFIGNKRVATGRLAEVAIASKTAMTRAKSAALLVFDDHTGEQVEVDLRGSSEAIRQRLAAPAPINTVAASSDTPPPRTVGRPKLGVVAREVTLLPRHWQWLNSQPGGASVALRKLVEHARRNNESKDRVRQAQEVTYRFVVAIAGNQPGFEAATRALFANQAEQFELQTANWPPDIRDHARKLAAAALNP